MLLRYHIIARMNPIQLKNYSFPIYIYMPNKFNIFSNFCMEIELKAFKKPEEGNCFQKVCPRIVIADKK